MNVADSIQERPGDIPKSSFKYVSADL
jgi:hypothetical protein